MAQINTASRVTIHMAASVDGFIARRDGTVDWLETSDHFDRGEAMSTDYMREVESGIDCYVMGSRTYETAFDFDSKDMGWPYGDKPTFVLTTRSLPKTRSSIEFHSGDLTRLVNARLKPNYGSIWFVGGGALSGECLRLGLADEIRYAILPVLIGDGISFFDRLDKDVALHLLDLKGYQNGMVELRYEVRRI
jgi:dihydrofolate reductase